MIIGSYAMKYHWPQFPRSPKDMDIVGESFVLDNLRKEIHINPVLLEHFKGVIPLYCPKDILYTLKLSHMFWDNNWEKHMWDITWMRDKGCKPDLSLFYSLYAYWNTVLKPNKRSVLEMSAEEFFDNAVKCEHSHDWLHTLINSTPTYTKVLKGEVEVCENKFNLLSYVDKCALVKEEVMVMAYERYESLGYRKAYNKMLKKFIISHAPLWEALFILENHRELSTPGYNYIELINNKIKQNNGRTVTSTI